MPSEVAVFGQMAAKQHIEKVRDARNAALEENFMKDCQTLDTESSTSGLVGNEEVTDPQILKL